jgi:hypothetical protein
MDRRRLGGFFLALGLLGGGLLEARATGAEEVAPQLKLYVKTRRAALRREPNLGAEILDAPAYGTALRQLNVRGSWYHVQDLTTENNGWIQKEEVGAQSPVLEAGYGKAAWGASQEEVAKATGAKPQGERLIEERAEGPIAAVAYNFRAGRLWYVEERYRLPAGHGLDDVMLRATERFGPPHDEGSRRWSRPHEGPAEGQASTETLMETRSFRWDTGSTGFALLSYGPLYDEGPVEVRAEYWSTAVAREAGLSGRSDGLGTLDFGGNGH